MKKFIVVLALVMMFFALPNHPPAEAQKPPQTAIVKHAEQVPDEIETSTETAIYSEVSAVESTAEELTEEALVIPETHPSECMEITEEPTDTETKKTMKYISEVGQSLAEYKPQIVGQPNPFENDTPTVIDDRPVEDYVGKGEDRPGEGIHF